MDRAVEVVMAFEISVAETDADILATYEVMRELRPKIQRSDYLQLVRLQEAEVGFRLASLCDDGPVASVAGFRFCRSLGWGRFLYVDDFVTSERRRSRGAGKALFRWLVEHARQSQCAEVRLDSALWRNGAHRFYLRERMDIVCFHFRLALTELPK
jgi:GNAT superfamily N-acetyltransferase